MAVVNFPPDGSEPALCPCPKPRQVRSPRLQKHRACMRELLGREKPPAGLSPAQKMEWWRERFKAASQECSRRIRQLTTANNC